MKNKVKVSVIIPCYNYGQFIDDAVNSVLCQTFQDFEIVIVNDGSTDKYTNTKLENYSKPKCEVIHTEHLGAQYARNIGIKKSKGEYILPLDADDKIGPRYLQEAVKVLEEKKEFGIVYCRAEFFGDKSGEWILPDYTLEKMLIRNVIFCSAMFRRSDYLKTKGFNPNMIYGRQDWDFWLSLIENGVKVFRLQEIHFYYRYKLRSTNRDLIRDEEKKAYSLKTIYLNHIDLYFENHGNPIDMYVKLSRILNSRYYKFGKFIKKRFKILKIGGSTRLR